MARLLSFALLIVLAGCSSTPEPSLGGIPTFNTLQEVEDAQQRALDLSSERLAAIDAGQRPGEEDRKALEEAARLWEGIALFSPNFFDAYFNLGTIYLALEEHSKAEQRLRQYLELAPGDKKEFAVTVADARYLLSQALFNQQKFEEALAEVEKALQKYPDTPNYLYARASALVQMNRTEEAETELQRALKAEPEHAKSQQLLRFLQSAKQD